MHLSCLHSHCNRNQGHKIHGFSPGAVSYKARISGMSWSIISGLVCWVTFPHCSWCPPVMSKLWQFLILYICKGGLFFYSWVCLTCHCTAWGIPQHDWWGKSPIPAAHIATSSKNIFWSHVLIWKKENTGVCFCFIWEVSNPMHTMPCGTITHFENLKYTHLYKPVCAFQNI